MLPPLNGILQNGIRNEIFVFPIYMGSLKANEGGLEESHPAYERTLEMLEKENVNPIPQPWAYNIEARQIGHGQSLNRYIIMQMFTNRGILGPKP